MNSEHPKVTVIGTGNVGTQFARIFDTVPFSSRSFEDLPTDSDIYIICVSDSAVEEVAARMPAVEGIVVHTTGSVPMAALCNIKCKGFGVLYPFQTISKNRPLLSSAIPLLIEGCDDITTEKIRNIAFQYGFTQVETADSEKRRKVHLCGVFACNFTNAMIAVSQKILDECGIDEKIINPLVGETIEKLKTLPAKCAQTGPAIRKDTATLDKHIELLQQLGMQAECGIYQCVSEYIMK